MDPDATLKTAARALKRGDKATAYEYLGYYEEWRSNGGFEPEGGDAQAAAIWDGLSEKYGEDPHGYEELIEGYDNPAAFTPQEAQTRDVLSAALRLETAGQKRALKKSMEAMPGYQGVLARDLVSARTGKITPAGRAEWKRLMHKQNAIVRSTQNPSQYTQLFKGLATAGLALAGVVGFVMGRRQAKKGQLIYKAQRAYPAE